MQVKKYLVLLLTCMVCSPGNARQTTQIKYLSGHGCDDAVMWEFFCTGGSNSGKWTEIPVPSCWELQGFGQYQYGNELRGKMPGEDLADEQGLYRYSFSVPSSWRGSHVELVFEGVMTDTEAKVNGVSTGNTHHGAFYRFSYDVSALLRYGKRNTLEVTVSKESDDASVNIA